MNSHTLSFSRKVFVATVIPAGAALFVLFVAETIRLLLIFFIGVLLALFLRAGGDIMHRITRIGETAGLFLFILLLLALMLVFGVVIAPQVADQLQQLGEQLPSALERLETQLRQIGWLDRILEEIPEQIERETETSPTILPQLGRVFSATVGILLGVAILIAVGIYMAARPDFYLRTLIVLFPPQDRDRVREVLGNLAHVLRMWLIGRAIGMTFVGVATAFGLAWLDVPLALALGTIAGLLDFIPNVGPLLAAIPGILIALTESPQLALYVVLIYFLVQELEAWLILPVVEQKVVRIGPAYNVIAQVILGLLFGFLGLMLATPLVVTGMVIVQEFYIRDFLQGGRAEE